MRRSIGPIVVMLAWIAVPGILRAEPAPIRVIVWDEQQPTQKKAYKDFLGNEIAEHLRGKSGLSVRSVRQDDPKQGLSDDDLEKCDVLIWWGHVRQREVKFEMGQKIVERIKQGKLSLIALHSAHWSTPFIEAMNERAVQDALAKLTPEQRKTTKVARVPPPLGFKAPRRDDPLTPTSRIRTEAGVVTVDVQLPNCCFPAYRADGKASHVRTLLPRHPIAEGLPEKFDIPNTEMYDEPFHVPAPDEVIFEERWDAGEKFRSGCVWKLGRGRVFYFRPGHETFGVYRRPEPLKIIENAVRWLAAEKRAAQAAPQEAKPDAEAVASWKKYEKNPVLGGSLGTCFDISVLREGDAYRMWFSWRPKKSVALVESKDGFTWSEPVSVLGPNQASGWEDDINRPVVIKNGDQYRMWYTGQAKGRSWIGHATSPDGKTWTRKSDKPVLSPEKAWEKVAVMCPHVLFDEKGRLYRMWYSGGEQYEPNAIGYATSPDGMKWTKHADNPIFKPDAKFPWEKDRVTACQVVKQGDGYVMFYIGFKDQHHAQIGVARSKDGITDWQRHPANPIIRPGKDRWDHDAVYKPYAIFDGKRWLLWYNGRKGGVEQIGVAIHDGEDLGF